MGTGFGMGVAGTSADEWDRTFALNLRSHFMLVRRALVTLPDDASIVFIGSVAGLRPGSRIPAYDASKAGLIGLSRHVAVEGARRGIRANVLAPGLIDTPLGRAASAGRPSRTRTPVPLGRQGTAWEVAAAAVFLLSEEASYITGQVLAVDGGLDPRMSAHSAQPRSASQQPPKTPRVGRRMARFNRAVVEQGHHPSGRVPARHGRRGPRRPPDPHGLSHAGQSSSATKDGFRFALDLRPRLRLGAQRPRPWRRAARSPGARSTS